MGKLRVDNRYGVIPNNVLNNKDLSFKAKGLYGYIQSKPDDWNFSIDRIKFDTKESRDSIRNGIKELEDMYYLIRNKSKNNKGFFEIDYVLYENPTYENPTYENATTDTSTNNKERNTNKEIKKKDIINYKPKTIVFGFEDFEYKISKFFLDAHIKDQTSSILFLLKKKTEDQILQKWSKEINDLKRIDGFNETQIDFVIKFTLKDDFRKHIILSIEKFRKNKNGISYFIQMVDKIKQQSSINNKKQQQSTTYYSI